MCVHVYASVCVYVCVIARACDPWVRVSMCPAHVPPAHMEGSPHQLSRIACMHTHCMCTKNMAHTPMLHSAQIACTRSPPLTHSSMLHSAQIARTRSPPLTHTPIPHGTHTRAHAHTPSFLMGLMAYAAWHTHTRVHAHTPSSLMGLMARASRAGRGASTSGAPTCSRGGGCQGGTGEMPRALGEAEEGGGSCGEGGCAIGSGRADAGRGCAGRARP